MTKAFLPDEADFSEICSNGRLNLGNVIHRAAIEVDELGPARSNPPRMSRFNFVLRGNTADDRPPVFRADRPFIFLIRDTRTGSIVLIGRVVKPEPFAGTGERNQSLEDEDAEK